MSFTGYILICALNVSYVNDEVNRQLKNGYKPYGNPVITCADKLCYSIQYCQAMVKEKRGL